MIASTLLGTHPPALPGRLLLALLARFGISDGTGRVALSRMVDKGELLNRRGEYALAGHLLARQQRQDQSRSPTQGQWDGSWEQAIIVGGATSAAARRVRRQSLLALKLAELREGVWIRPGNLAFDRLPDQVARGTSEIVWGNFRPAWDPTELAGRLWDQQPWAERAEAYTAELSEMSALLDRSDDDVLEPGFVLSAAVLRHFVADPELPAALLPTSWPGPELRLAYDGFDLAYRTRLRNFFAIHRH